MRPTLPYRRLITTFITGVLAHCAAHASADLSCDSVASLRQSGYACGGVPFLSPNNDTRLNAILLTDTSKITRLLPDPQAIPPANRTRDLVVPFVYDFSTWGATKPNDSNADAQTQSSDYAEGEGDICHSMASGAASFNSALEHAKDLAPNDAAQLSAARIAMGSVCVSGASPGWKPPAGIRSEVGKQFARYLDGANAFYRHDFASATKAFAAVSRSPDSWLKETGLYMAGRAQLNAAQANAFSQDNFDRNSKAVNQPALGAADTVFRTYLRVYPRGRYALSTEGLQRRVAWLGANTAQQAEMYKKALTTWSPGTSNVTLGQLVNELDDKLLARIAEPGQIRSPLVLAVLDLMRMRGSQTDDSAPPVPLTLSELNAQRPTFAATPALHDYLLAAYHVYVDGKPEKALALLPQAPGASLDYFALSQQTLRGFALEDSGQPAKAREHWAQFIPLAQNRMQRETLELAFAINLERSGRVESVFADDSLIQNPAIRSILLQRAATADLLRAQAQNKTTSGELRDIALYTLLYKEFVSGRFADFTEDVALTPPNPGDALKPFMLSALENTDGYACPSARQIAQTLQRNPKDAKGLICQAEFFRLHDVAYSFVTDPGEWHRLNSRWYGDQQTAGMIAAAQASAKVTLGDAPSPFPGKMPERMLNYRTVMSDTHAAPDDRAYALYRAINCYAPGGTSECGGVDVSKEKRRQWFNTLKSAYPNTRWARSLKYYW